MTNTTGMHSLGPEEVVGVFEKEPSTNMGRTRCIKAVVALALLSLLTYIIVDSLTAHRVGDAIIIFLEWVEANPIRGVFIFAVVYCSATIFFIPGSILTLGAGFVFAHNFGLGMVMLFGTLPCFVGACTGAMFNFLLARYIFRDWVQGMLREYPIFEALEICMAENTKGFRVMALMHLSPVIPFTALNYVAGITSISFSSFAVSLVFILPGSVLYVFVGASAGSLAESARNGKGNKAVTIGIVVLGIVFAIAGVFLTSHFARKELNQIIEGRKAEIDQGSRNNLADAPAVERGEAV